MAGAETPHAALLIDFDNVTMGMRSDLSKELKTLLDSDVIKGKVSVQRAYADWRRYPQYIVPLTEASIDLIFAPAVGANKKNATDIRLAIDALELVFTRPEIGTFILLSGDSDFSALVLKLKEYGKFVIGVGIRESSSDLLVQNCDEYYSYNELTGLARTGEEEIIRHDPWELVVEAVQKMQKSGDVMRSDRLKQVMQSIDPSFDEKDAGCNRFSKFVVQAGQRGLLRLTKMENGQYAVDVGPNANVSVEQDPPVLEEVSVEPATTTPRRKKSTRASAERETKQRTLTLSEGFDLLKRALVALGAVGDEATVADKAREGMVEIHGNESDPVFEAKRFQRMLRQAHDADVIELIKSDGDDYMLKLSATVAAATAAAAGGAEEAGELRGEGEDATAPKKATKRKTVKKKTTRKSPRSRARAAAKEGPEEEAAEVTAQAGEAGEDSAVAEAAADATAPKKTAKRKTVKKKTTRAKEKDEPDADKPKKATKRNTVKKKTTRTRKKSEESAAAEAAEGEVSGAAEAGEKQAAAAPIVNPRFRRGGRSPKPTSAVTEKPAESDVKDEPSPTPAPTPRAATGPRTLGMRSGSKAAKHARKQAELEDSTKPAESKDQIAAEPAQQVEALQKTEPKPAPVQEPVSSPPEASPTPKPAQEPAPLKDPQPAKDPEQDGAGLFRKVTAAFQRAMGTAKEDDE